MNYLHEDADGQDLAATQLFNVLPHPYKIRRFPIWGGRKYFAYKDGNIWIGTGATSIKDFRVPPSRYLLDYYKEWGEEADENSATLADIGTFMHYLFGEILTAYANKQAYVISKTKIGNDLRDYMMHNGLKMSAHQKFTTVLTHYCAAIYHWLNEWGVEVESIEFPIAWFDANIGTCSDGIIKCWPPDKIGNGTMSKPIVGGEKVRVCTNLKTRIKSQASYEDDGYQVGAEVAAYNEYLPSHPADHGAILVPCFTSQSGVSYKFVFYDFYKKEDILFDIQYWKGMVKPSIDMQKFLYPERFLDAPYEDGGELKLDFQNYDPEFQKKTRGKSKASMRSIRDWCMDFFTENHV